MFLQKDATREKQKKYIKELFFYDKNMNKTLVKKIKQTNIKMILRRNPKKIRRKCNNQREISFNAPGCDELNNVKTIK